MGIFLFTTAYRLALCPTQPPIQLVSRVLSLGVKRPEREAEHSPPSSAEVKNTPLRRGADLKKAQGHIFLLYSPIIFISSKLISRQMLFARS